MKALDSTEHQETITKRIQGKKSLCALYVEYYQKFVDCQSKAPVEGINLEIGSGAGFLKDILPDVVTTDLLPYHSVDVVLDAKTLPFRDRTIKSVFMLNTFHHISNAERLFHELSRCMVPGGRILIIDQYLGWLSTAIFKYLHHEPLDSKSKDWGFKSTGPLSGANGALCWIIFLRDRKRFLHHFPGFHIIRCTPHTPFRYWLTGGLKRWNLFPAFMFSNISAVESIFARRFPGLCSFVDVELVRQ